MFFREQDLPPFASTARVALTRIRHIPSSSQVRLHLSATPLVHTPTHWAGATYYLCFGFVLRLVFYASCGLPPSVNYSLSLSLLFLFLFLVKLKGYLHH